MFMIDYKQLNWWYWLVIACLLSVGVSGYKIGFILAIGVSLFHLAHFLISEQRVTAFTVQVRFWYLMILLVSYPEPMQIIYWLPALGTWARVIFGYCLLARILSLMPWNRHEPFSARLVMKTFFSRPVCGSIMHGLPAVPKMAGSA